MTNAVTSIDLDDKEKKLFIDWLSERQKLLSDELQILKRLEQKLESKHEVKRIPIQNAEIKSHQNSMMPAKAGDSLSWVDIIKTELKQFSHPVPSGEIVKRILQKSSFAEKGKRFITKAVTSKLWLLQERGEVAKSRENGKYVYSLKKL